MNISEIVSKIDLRDSTPFFDFTKKWIGYVTSKKRSVEISDNDWSELFGRRNPVAGIDWGEMTEVASFATKKGKNTKNTNEQSSFKGKWDTDIRPAIEAAINIKDASEKLQKIKDLNQLIQNIITDGGGRDRTTAINRILTTFFPDLFVTIPQPERLSEFIVILQKEIANGSTITKADNWIDNSYQVKRFLDKELGDDNLTASAWRFYDYLKEDKPKEPIVIKEDTKATTSMDKNKYDDFQKLLLGNYNLILTGAPGTGKTYLAKKIALAIGASEKSIKMVQFHPSYDYTDFVEGLRPIKEGDTLGFQRKDGVFKTFCKEALKYEKPDVDSALAAFHSDLKRKGISIKSHKSNTTFEVRLTEKNYKIFTSTNNCPKDGYNCAFDAVRKYIETGDYIEGHQTYQPSIGEYVKENYMKRIPFVFIIDEINRGEISKIFGELFYSIDAGYRGIKGRVETQYQNLVPEDDVFSKGFYIPQNVYIIGTMNDIDRSVESMDFAMRRRFAWKEITAESRQSMLDEDEAWGTEGKPSEKVIDEMKVRMDNLNSAIIDQYGDEELSNKDKVGLTKAYQIGAAYFLKYVLYNNFKELWTNHLEGLLYEYLRGKTNVDEKIKRLYQAYNDTTTH